MFDLGRFTNPVRFLPFFGYLSAAAWAALSLAMVWAASRKSPVAVPVVIAPPRAAGK